jgi:hypothetical protein
MSIPPLQQMNSHLTEAEIMSYFGSIVMWKKKELFYLINFYTDICPSTQFLSSF